MTSFLNGDWQRVAVALHRTGAPSELVRCAVERTQQTALRQPSKQSASQQQFLRYLATFKQEALLSPRGPTDVSTLVPATNSAAVLGTVGANDHNLQLASDIHPVRSEAGPRDRPLSPGVVRTKKKMLARTGSRAVFVTGAQDSSLTGSVATVGSATVGSDGGSGPMPPLMGSSPSASKTLRTAAASAGATVVDGPVLRLLSAPERDALRLFFGSAPANSLLIKCQSVVRQWLARRRTKKMWKQAAHRKKVLQEILDSEQVFAQSLDQVKSLFLGPLKEKTAAATDGRALVSRLFGNIDMISAFSDELLAALQQRCAEAGGVSFGTSVGDVFLSFVSYMKVFGAYCAGYDGASSQLQEIMAVTAAAADGLCEDVVDDGKPGDLASPRSPRSKQNQQSPDEERRRLMVVCGRWIQEQQPVQLASLLITPVQRLPRYRMLLEDLLKHTWPGHRDREPLERAVAAVAGAASDVNLVVKRAEGSARVQQLAKQLRGGADLASDPDRLLVREGPIAVRVQGLKPRSVQFRGLLFTDTFVVAQADKIVHRLALRDALVQDMRDMQLIRNAFQLVTRELPLAIVCSSKADKRGWLTALTEVVRQCGGKVGGDDDIGVVPAGDEADLQPQPPTLANIRDRKPSVSHHEQLTGRQQQQHQQQQQQQQHLLSPRTRSRRGTGAIGDGIESAGKKSGGSGITKSSRSPSVSSRSLTTAAATTPLPFVVDTDDENGTGTPASPTNGYQVKVVGTEERLLPKVHTVYVLQVTSLTTGALHRVFRRYSEFDSLASALRRRLTNTKGLPALPKKTFNLRFQGGHMSAKALESRQLGLDSFVQALTMRADAMDTMEVKQFLKLPDGRNDLSSSGPSATTVVSSSTSVNEFMLSVFLVDATSKTFRVHGDTTCADVCNLMCRKLRISDKQGDCFSLFLSLPMSFSSGSSAASLTASGTLQGTALVGDPSKSSPCSADAVEHSNNNFVVDSDTRFERVLDDDENPVKLLKESGDAGRLVYRKAVYLMADMGDARALPAAERELVYAQARSDILRARIVADEPMAVRLAALSVVKEFGGAGDHVPQFQSFISKFVPRHLVKKRPAGQWEQLISEQVQALVDSTGGPSSLDPVAEYLNLVSQSPTYGTQMWPCEPLGDTKKEFAGGSVALAVRFDGVLVMDLVKGSVLRQFPFAHFSFNSTPKGFVIAGPLNEFSFKTRAGLTIEDSVHRHMSLC